MILVLPIGTAIVLRQIATQRGIRVTLMEKKAEMDGTMVELLGGIETIRTLDSALEEMRHHKAMAKYDCLKFINEAVFSVLVIAALPGQYQFRLAEGGANLSGGQRQRMALARIFLRQPRILILDEATSALDNTSELYIQQEIEAMSRAHGATVISIAHRLSTLRNCDEILVMDRGEIVQRGTYESLAHTPGLFQDMLRGVVT